jgi:hypothetical protein
VFFLKKNQNRLLSAGDNDRTYSLLDQVDTDDQLYGLGYEIIHLYDYYYFNFISRDLQAVSSRPKEVKVKILFLN